MWVLAVFVAVSADEPVPHTGLWAPQPGRVLNRLWGPRAGRSEASLWDAGKEAAPAEPAASSSPRFGQLVPQPSPAASPRRSLWAGAAPSLERPAAPLSAPFEHLRSPGYEALFRPQSEGVAEPMLLNRRGAFQTSSSHELDSWVPLHGPEHSPDNLFAHSWKAPEKSFFHADDHVVPAVAPPAHHLTLTSRVSSVSGASLDEESRRALEASDPILKKLDNIAAALHAMHTHVEQPPDSTEFGDSLVSTAPERLPPLGAAQVVSHVATSAFVVPDPPFVAPPAPFVVPEAAGQLRPVDRPDSLFRKSFAAEPRSPPAAAAAPEPPARSPPSRSLLHRGSDVQHAGHARKRANSSSSHAYAAGAHHGHRHIETRQNRLNRLFTQPDESSVYREAPPFQRPRVSFARIIGDVTRSAAIST